jgi:hypothetical protein
MCLVDSCGLFVSALFANNIAFSKRNTIFIYGHLLDTHLLKRQSVNNESNKLFRVREAIQEIREHELVKRIGKTDTSRVSIRVVVG